MEPATILLVDDNPVNLSVFRALLNKDNHELVATDSGLSAIELARNNPAFDLVLLDVALPDIDGIEVCRRLKADPRTNYLPVVLISAVKTDDDSIGRGLEAGADGYITKPIDDVALRAWVRATLRISRLQRRLSARTGDEGDLYKDNLLAEFAKLSHTVNNPLQALFATADILLLELPENSDARRLVTEILSYAETVAAVVANASHRAKSLVKEEQGNV